VAGALPAILLLAAYNLHVFGKLMVFGQMGIGAAPATDAQVPLASTLGGAVAAAGTLGTASHYFGTSLVEGLAGSMVSPSRGLLVFSPVVAFGLWGLLRTFRDSRFSAMRPVGIAAVALFLVVACWFSWFGGWSYGPRLLTDNVTLLAFLAIPVADEIRQRRILATAFGVCLAWSVAVQAVGAFAYDVAGWNNRTLSVVTLPGKEEPRFYIDRTEAQREAQAHGGSIKERAINVDQKEGRARLWSIRDSEILYYIEHFFKARARKQLTIKNFLDGQG
jgi:hypothetical protein